MSRTESIFVIAILITLTRGFGQSALSVVSITIVGKWFVRRLNAAMAVYTVILSVGFMIAFPVVGAMVLKSGWRSAWAAIGFCLLFGLAPLALLLVRSSPEACGLKTEEMRTEPQPDQSPAEGQTLRQALATPAFWVFGIATAIYGLIASGIALFNESILAERGSSLHISSDAGNRRTDIIGGKLSEAGYDALEDNRFYAGDGFARRISAGVPHVKTQCTWLLMLWSWD